MTRAVQANTIGQPLSVSVNEIDPPVPGPGRLVVRVVAGGVGPWDASIAAGLLGQQPTPLTLGAEAAGIVETVGEGVHGFHAGDAVITYPGLFGAWAELISVPAERTARAPQRIPLVDAAALPVCGSTALQSLDLLDLPRGATLLILGAGGAVGRMAAQAAQACGLRVVGTASPRHHARLSELGATTLVDYQNDWAGEMKRALSAPVDGVLDLVGPDALRCAFPLLAEGARMVTAIVRSRTVEAPEGSVLQFVGSYGRHETLKQVTALVNAGILHAEIAARHPVEQAAQAVQEAATSHAPGKILLTF